MRRKERASWEICAFYIYDDEYGAYLYDMSMDKDDYVGQVLPVSVLQKRRRVYGCQKADVERNRKRTKEELSEVMRNNSSTRASS